MGSFLGDLVVRLKAETADFEQDMGKAAHSAERAMGQMQKAAAALGATISAGAFVALVKHSIDSADKLHDLAISTKTSALEIGALGFVAKQSGTDIEGVAASFGKLNKNIAEALSGNERTQKVFSNLGITMKDLRTLSPHEVLLKLSDAMKGADEDATKAAYGQALLGKSYMSMLPLLEEGSAKIRQQTAYYVRYSGVTEDLVKKADEFNDELVKLELLSKAVGMQFATAFLPLMKEAVDELIRMKEASNDVSTSMSGFLELMKVISVMALETSFAIITMGKDMARAAENVKLIATGRWDESRELGALFRADAEKARQEHDRFIARIVALRLGGNLASPAGTTKDLNAFADVGNRPESRTKLKALPRSETEAAALLKAQSAAIQSMEEKRKSLFGTTEEALMAERLYGSQISLSSGRMVELKGTYEKFDPVVKTWLMMRAKEADQHKQLADRVDASMRAYTALHDAQESANESMRNFLLSISDANEERAFELSLVGKLSTEQEKLNAMRKIDLDLRRQLSDLANIYGEQDPEGLKRAQDAARRAAELAKAGVAGDIGSLQQGKRLDEMRKMTEQVMFDTEALTMNARQLEVLQALRNLDIQQFGRVLTEEQRAILLSTEDREERQKLIDSIKHRQEVERDWATGATKALRDYADASMNAAANAEMFFSNAFKSMEDALVNFVKTSKLDFKSLADSIISDLIRIQVRAAITGPLSEAMSGAGGISGMMGSLFGFGKSATTFNLATPWLGAPEFASGTDSVPRTGMALIHQGEKIIPAAENIASRASSSSGLSIGYLDMKGASLEAVQRLERFVQQVDGSIEQRAVAAVQDQSLRGNRV